MAERVTEESRMLSLTLFVAALVLLYAGGEMLVRGASGLALRVGLSRLGVGLTVVAFGTSAPELVVSVDAALAGNADISVGNVVGSNIANIALILGVSAMLRPLAVHAHVVRLDVPIMIATAVALLAVMRDGVASRTEGALLVAALVAYLAFTFRAARRESGDARDEIASAAQGATSRPIVAATLVVAGLSALLVGGHLLVATAVRLASALGVGQAAIGLTIVAVGTSVPELATAMVASMRGQGDIALGNVIGSNIFNVLGILGVAALVLPLRAVGLTWLDLGVMTTLSFVLIALLRTGFTLGRVEGALLLAAYVVYTWHLLG